jgi:hypothetical protein
VEFTFKFRKRAPQKLSSARITSFCIILDDILVDSCFYVSCADYHKIFCCDSTLVLVFCLFVFCKKKSNDKQTRLVLFLTLQPARGSIIFKLLPLDMNKNTIDHEMSLKSLYCSKSTLQLLAMRACRMD